VYIRADVKRKDGGSFQRLANCTRVFQPETRLTGEKMIRVWRRSGWQKKGSKRGF
jgi:hypothetical protein